MKRFQHSVETILNSIEIQELNRTHYCLSWFGFFEFPWDKQFFYLNWLRWTDRNLTYHILTLRSKALFNNRFRRGLISIRFSILRISNKRQSGQIHSICAVIGRPVSEFKHSRWYTWKQFEHPRNPPFEPWHTQQNLSDRFCKIEETILEQFRMMNWSKNTK